MKWLSHTLPIRRRFPSSLVALVSSTTFGIAALGAEPPGDGGGPVVVEPGWAVVRVISFTEGIATHYNPVDDALYVGRRSGSDRGLYRIDPDDTVTALWTGDDVAAVVVDPVGGDVFVSDDFTGEIFRTAFGEAGRTRWVRGFHGGDDDPVGMAIVPPDYTGDFLSPGEALVVDRGFNGPREVWQWSVVTPEGETVVHADDGTLVDPVDVTISESRVFLVDTGDDDLGMVFEILGDGALSPVGTDRDLHDPAGVAADPTTGDLLVLDSGGSSEAARLVRLDPDTGEIWDVVVGFDLANVHAWAGVDVSLDGSRFVVTDGSAGVIYEFGRELPSTPPIAMCENVVTSTDALCQADVVATDVGGGSMHPDGNPITLELHPPGPFTIGVTDVTLIVTDDLGEASSCDATVTVVDDTPPDVVCPPGMTFPVNSECTAEVPDVASEATLDDNCTDPVKMQVAQDPRAGTLLAPGAYEVIVTAVDEHGNENACTTSVTVVDESGPEIVCGGPSTITPRDPPVSFPAHVSDACDVARVTILEYECYFINPRGKRIDRTDDCAVDLDGDTVVIRKTSGVGTQIVWSVLALDAFGNASEAECRVEVVRPGRRHHDSHPPRGRKERDQRDDDERTDRDRHDNEDRKKRNRRNDDDRKERDRREDYDHTKDDRHDRQDQKKHDRHHR